MDSNFEQEGGFPDGSMPVCAIEALIIPPERHRISEKALDREALKVLYRLRDAGFHGYLVGGGVRDLYLGKQPKDFDISTDARPGQLRKIFRNSRTIGRRFRLVQVYFHGNKIIEVSTLRSHGEYEVDDDVVLPHNNTFGTLEEDAFRRDLTINALFYEVESGTIIDYVGGVADLNAGLIRIVGEPERRIIRDPVRMLRAIRHAARNGFTIEEKTWEAIVAHRDKLSLCPTSRIRDELLKDLHGGAAADWVLLAAKSGILGEILPMYPHDGEHTQHWVEQLHGLFGVVDRLHAQGSEDKPVVVPDQMLFALLLVPWARHRFRFGEVDLKGPALHRLRETIRVEVDGLIGESLNLKRMLKEGLASLLVNLPFFEQQRKGDDWPVWLRKKSYFADGARFYGLVQQGRNVELSPEQFTIKADAVQPPLVPLDSQPAGNDPSSGKRHAGQVRPAFSSSSQGIFGMKKS